MEILFVRHGQTDHNAARLIQGRNDPSLNQTGLAQAKSLARQLMDQPFELIISSPLKRARQTAEVIAEQTGRPVQFDERLMERDFGGLQNQPYDRLRCLPGSGLPDFFCDAYGEYQVEPMADMLARVSDFLSEIAGWPDTRLLVVAHGGIGYVFDQLLKPTAQPQVAANGQVHHYFVEKKD